MTTEQSGGSWNPVQYERFKEQRSQPFFDLLALVRPMLGNACYRSGLWYRRVDRHLA